VAVFDKTAIFNDTFGGVVWVFGGGADEGVGRASGVL